MTKQSLLLGTSVKISFILTAACFTVISNLSCLAEQIEYDLPGNKNLAEASFEYPYQFQYFDHTTMTLGYRLVPWFEYSWF